MCTVTLAVGDRNSNEGQIIGHWYDEALTTGITHIARGAIEALVPLGWIGNASLDAIGALYNLLTLLDSVSNACSGYTDDRFRPYPNPEYPFPICVLELV